MSNSSGSIVTLGECLISLTARDPGPLADARSFERFVGGAEANVAVGLARLGHAVSFIGRVGDDPFGTCARRHLAGEGVDIAHLATSEGRPTAVMIRGRSMAGLSEVAYYRSGSAGSTFDVADLHGARTVVENATWLHLTGITPALSETCSNAVAALLLEMTNSSTTVSLDVNFRRKLWSEAQAERTLRPLLSRVDVLLAGSDEARLLSGIADPTDAAQWLHQQGPSTFVHKRGTSGADSYLADGGHFNTPAHDVQLALDVVGAGDAFAAGYISAAVDGLDEPARLKRGAMSGAAVAASVGDMSGLPSRAELSRLNESNHDVDR